LTLRARIHGLLDEDSHGHAARRVRALEVLLILVGITSVSAGTVDGLAPTARAIAAAVTGAVAVLFLVGYLARLWIAPTWTVSQSESGFDAVYQGSGVMPVWDANVPAGAGRDLEITLRLSRLP